MKSETFSIETATAPLVTAAPHGSKWPTSFGLQWFDREYFSLYLEVEMRDIFLCAHYQKKREIPSSYLDKEKLKARLATKPPGDHDSE